MDLPLLRPRIFDAHGGIRAALTTRKGGVSPPPLGMNISFMVGDAEQNVRTNRALFFAAAGFPPNSAAFPGQVHGSTVQAVTAPGNYPRTDALLTRSPGITLCVTTADCVPILLFDPVRNCVAAVHAGWRGTEGRILEKTVTAMHDRFGTLPSDLLAFIGPAASACCYEVGEEVSGRFPGQFVLTGGARPRLDLKAANRAQLQASAVPDTSIEVDPSCTICEEDRFHSYRRDGPSSGRMMACIALIPPDG